MAVQLGISKETPKSEDTTSLLTNDEKNKAYNDTHKTSPKPRRQTWRLVAKAWRPLLLHALCAAALTLSMALALDGYKALDDDKAAHAQIIGSRLVLRVSDVTTVISAALVVVRLLVSSWTTRMVWACAQRVYSDASKRKKEGNTEQNKADQDIKVAAAYDAEHIRRWKLPAWMSLRPSMSKLPRTGSQLIMSVALILGAAQGVISPLLSGAVGWSSQLVAAGLGDVQVAAVDPQANFTGWYWFRYDSYTGSGLTRRSRLRTAAGMASLAWGDQTTIAGNGTSLTGNGCRHIVTADSQLGINSTLIDAVMPCIQIHDVLWFAPTDHPSLHSPNLSIVDDNPRHYYEPGVSVIYDNNSHWTEGLTSEKPAATLHAGTAFTFWIMIKRVRVQEQKNQSDPCANIDPTIFGAVDDINARSRYVRTWGNDWDKNCYWYGRVNFTAGVTRSRTSTYILPRVVEGQTPIGDVVFEADSWVQEALWMLPDLMTMVAVMNSTLLPTHDNSEGYFRALLARSYLAAWDVLHHTFDEDQRSQTYRAIPAVSRQTASVSLTRIFAWLACCLLMTASGIWLLLAVIGVDDLEITADHLEEYRSEKKGIIYEGLQNLEDIVPS